MYAARVHGRSRASTTLTHCNDTGTLKIWWGQAGCGFESEPPPPNCNRVNVRSRSQTMFTRQGRYLGGLEMSIFVHIHTIENVNAGG